MAEFRARSRLFHESGLPVNEDSAPCNCGQGRVASNSAHQTGDCDHRNGTFDSQFALRKSEPTMSHMGLVSRVTPVQTAKRNCTRDEGGPFEFGNQVPISNHRKLLSPKATVVNVAGVSGI